MAYSFTPVGSGDYGTWAFYVYTDETGNELTASLTDSLGKGVSLSFAPSETGWTKAVVPLGSGDASLSSGETVSVSRDSGVEDFSRLVFSTGGPSGTFYLDEVILTEPEVALGASAGAEVDARYPGNLVSLGKYPLLASPSLNAGGTISVSEEDDEALWVADGDLSASIDVAFIKAEGDFDIAGGTGYTELSGGHTLTFPSFSFPAQVSDQYAYAEGGEERASRVTCGCQIDQ